MKTIQRTRKYVSLILAVIMLLSMNTVAFAASGSQQRSASGKVTVALEGGASGYSNTVTFNFNSLPRNAVVTRITVSAPLSRHQGTNAIKLNGYYISSPLDGELYFNVSSGSSLTTYAFAGASARGTWTFCLRATCLDSGIPPYMSPFPVFFPIYSSNTYYPVKMTIYYTY